MLAKRNLCSRRAIRPSAGAFTLIELLVVITIIVILAAMITPAVMWGIRKARDLGTQTRIDRLANGIVAYKQDKLFFPGQDILAKIGTAANPTQYTGSQILAAAMLGYDYNTITTAADEAALWPTSNGVPSKGYILYSRDGTNANAPDNTLMASYGTAAAARRFVLSDGFGTERMPIAYFVTNPIHGGGPAQFQLSQNSVMTDPATTPAIAQAGFEAKITNPLTPGRPYKDQEFLLIAPGMDRKWFTDDDRKNWTISE
ncbi:MAG: prepilin-type N-terminal cleavage/methylation domain-containing protein [Planctomycetaceae bacterium]